VAQSRSAGDTSSATPLTDAYAVLGVPPDADATTLAQAYRRAARRTHPDTGGSAEAFAAVQAAWQALSGDRPDPVDPWTVGDWGVDAQPAAPPTSPSHPDRAPSAHDSAGADDDAWGETSPGDDWGQTSPDDDLPAPGPDTHRNPFAPGAVRLPEPTLPIRRTRPLPRRGALDRVLECAMGAAAATAIGTTAVAGSRIPGPAYLVVGAWLVFFGLGVLIGHSRGAFGVIAWTLPVLLVTVPVAAWASNEGGAAARTLMLAVAALCAAATWWEHRRVRRSRPPQHGGREAARIGARLKRHHLALRWNEVRRALATPGSTVARVVESGFQDPARRWMCIDAVTGSTTIPDLSAADVELNSWVVLDPSGAVLVVAPTDAPRAWAAAVRRAASAQGVR